jgi:hypothetical protein
MPREQESMDTRTTQLYIVLDPDGTQDFGLIVVVAAATGVTYAHQCAGLDTEERQLEGFAVPVGSATAAEPLRAFFRRRFHGNPPLMTGAADSSSGGLWSEAALSELSTLVSQIAFWATFPPSTHGDDRREFLQLDLTRLTELTEAWIPVRTAFGSGVLVFANCD